ncbi:unknown function [Klebsiella phage vB_Kpl_K72PH164C2]|uniref:Uncharacterized protein n=1 Tax=Klebsiella phage vB_Kpl_K72PH164C2 TaxID=3071646 RepID=A0AAD2JTP3_9CAUD|nr:unknown function [Klebsiella phage vB_Kpl_K72PH164C2]
MSKFKVGDKVVRKPFGLGDEEFLSALGLDIYYIVTSVSAGGCWLQVDGVSKPSDNKRPWFAPNFELYQEPEDEGLPPVPDSVYYPDMYTLLTGKPAAGGTSGLTVRQSPYTEGAISLSINHSKWARLDADAALQLAHDLRRMAKEIKRKGKAQ